MTGKAPDPEVTDPSLKGAADLLRGLRSDPPPSAPAMAEAVVAQVRPVALRRRRVMLGIGVTAALAVVGYLITLLGALSE